MAKASTKSIAKSEYDWQAEDDLRTMMASEEIEKDPKRLAKVQALAKKKMLDMAALASEGKDD
jgi:hypothetical protein